MTAQRSDTIFIDGEEYSVITASGDYKFRPNEYGFQPLQHVGLDSRTVFFNKV